jgi:2-oxo-4-hydroxy-4-carboxy-5-ureidoimidazoline decarboxylase
MGEPLDLFNALTHEQAIAHLTDCCASTAWATALSQSRPFSDVSSLLAASDRATAALARTDLDDAFAGHPRIGERSTHAWSAQEQSGVDQGKPALAQELVDANREYEAKFGHVFLICATGKSGDEMVAECRRRLNNEPENEIEEAREELRLINRIRIEKLLNGLANA